MTSSFYPIYITTQNDIADDGISFTADFLHEFKNLKHTSLHFALYQETRSLAKKKLCHDLLENFL